MRSKNKEQGKSQGSLILLVSALAGTAIVLLAILSNNGPKFTYHQRVVVTGGFFTHCWGLVEGYSAFNGTYTVKGFCHVNEMSSGTFEVKESELAHSAAGDVEVAQ